MLQALPHSQSSRCRGRKPAVKRFWAWQLRSDLEHGLQALQAALQVPTEKASPCMQPSGLFLELHL